MVGSRGQRVLSAQGQAGGCSQDELATASLKKDIWFNTALRSFDMVPPRPAVIAHGKVLRVVYEPRFGTSLSLHEVRPSVLARPDGAAFARVG